MRTATFETIKSMTLLTIEIFEIFQRLTRRKKPSQTSKTSFNGKRSKIDAADADENTGKWNISCINMAITPLPVRILSFLNGSEKVLMRRKNMSVTPKTNSDGQSSNT